jgi:hypothetical protein
MAVLAQPPLEDEHLTTVAVSLDQGQQNPSLNIRSPFQGLTVPQEEEFQLGADALPLFGESLD